ncbi:hypothetical protein NGTWS0302_34630 [Mycolicibacterium cyprinidarum]|uniref:Protein-glutamine gamma-glutamyltransferase-like C-terminal domain-containing protein n=1 Tax=Mycolicibacterium cyprinidarum TaxID=2860311 RepID=A0ABQ4VFS8_9MYCO|nr:hypothetical protein NGTWS0302_34630 [Mycolicibacterium sp. NGTWS0302]GJF18365.1 hypothetical protein NGTWS1702_26230 [Mycolicibacterium sp. NGTWSNA01]
MPDDDKPDDDKAVARTVAVIVLLLLAVVALKGYLPGVERAPDSPEPESSGTGSVVAAFVLLGVSIIIMVIAIVEGRRRPAGPTPGELPRDRGGRSRVSWRLLLIVVAVILTWLLVVLLLMRSGSGFVIDAPPVPDPDANTRPEGGQPEPESPADHGNVFGLLMAASIALLVVSIAGTLIARRRVDAVNPVPAGSGVSPEDSTRDGPDLARAAELGLAEVGDRSRDPREAIIACYAAMERELAKSPGTTPQDSDTPAEVLARAVERHALQADSAAELVDLFEEARFSAHVMNEGHRAAAVRALRLVQRELQGVT